MRQEAKSGPKLGFCFLKFGALFFLLIAYDDSLEQCLITSRGKPAKKLAEQIWAKIGPKIRFFVIFSV